MVLYPAEQQLILPNRACTSDKYPLRKILVIRKFAQQGVQEKHLIDFIASPNLPEPG